jgi:hypothetical protein
VGGFDVIGDYFTIGQEADFHPERPPRTTVGLAYPALASRLAAIIDLSPLPQKINTGKFPGTSSRRPGSAVMCM